MEVEQIVTLLTWINQADPRMQLTAANRDMWHYSLSAATYEDAKQAVLEHYRYNDTDMPNPGTIRKRAAVIKSSREAKQQALTAGPTTTMTYNQIERRVMSPEFRMYFDQGVAEGNAIRAAADKARNGG
jgi:hypothetical protein